MRLRAGFTIEHWKPIPDYEGLYEVSNHGRVRSLDRTLNDGRRLKGRKLKQVKNHSGYFQVALSKNGKPKTRLVHRLVMHAFRGPCPDGMEVAHNNGWKHESMLWNLRYATRSENERDKVRHGRNNQTRKTHCPRLHSLIEPNLVQSDLKKGRRSCLSCDRTRSRVYRRPELEPDFQRISDEYYAALMATNKEEK